VRDFGIACPVPVLYFSCCVDLDDSLIVDLNSLKSTLNLSTSDENTEMQEQVIRTA
jgi:hypothetical protein